MLHNLLRKMCDEWKKYWNNSCYIIQTKLLMQKRPSFFLNFPYTWSQSHFLFLGETVQYFSLIAMEIDEDQTLQ